MSGSKRSVSLSQNPENSRWYDDGDETKRSQNGVAGFWHCLRVDFALKHTAFVGDLFCRDFLADNTISNDRSGRSTLVLLRVCSFPNLLDCFAFSAGSNKKVSISVPAFAIGI